MIAAGIDVGAKTTKAVIVDDERIVGLSSLVQTGFDQLASARKAFLEALKQAGKEESSVERVVSTGAGAKAVTFATTSISDMRALARGVAHGVPTARTVIDVGAEEGRAVRLDENGRPLDFAVNEKCAAGTGAFVEAMSRALDVPLDEMGALSLESQREVTMNAQCAVFAESEVVSLIHARVEKQDIIRAVHNAIASRIGSMVRRVGIEDDVALVGGLAHNLGFVDALKRNLKVELMVPAKPEFVCAAGAALEAASREK